MTTTNIPAGYREVPEEDRKKAKRFFDHARSVSSTGQYDYAIEMYINGLALDPDDVEQHKALREMSLKRKVSGGKDMGMLERRKYPTSTKDDKTNMLNAERMLAFDPGNSDYMLVVAQSAYRGGYYDSATWFADMCFRANSEIPKPSFQRFIAIKDVYKGIGDFHKASEACLSAYELRPEDMTLKGEMKDLAAQHTMDKGNYARAKSFRDSVRDKEHQQKLMDEDRDVRSEDHVAKKVRETRTDWEANRSDAARFSKYIDALKATEQLEHENVAIDELEKMFKSSKQFKYRANAGQIKMAQLNRMERSMRADVQAHPNDAQRRKDLQDFIRDKTATELEEFSLMVENYPTDSNARFEKAKRMFMLGQFQDVIPVLQQVRHDPKFRAGAGTLLARSFLEAQFVDEAIDTLKTIIDEYPGRGDDKSKDMTYWYGRALEMKGEIPTAIKQYSLVAQMEFKYKDVQERIKKLRSETPK